MIEGFTVRQLHHISGLSSSSLRRILHYWLAHPPVLDTIDLKSARHLIFDGTFLQRRHGIVAVMNASLHRILYGQYGIHENSQPQLQIFFATLKARGLHPISYTVDGNPHVIRVLRSIWPTIIIQRCLVHIQRQGLMWCRRHPSRYDAKQLRKLLLLVTSIRTRYQKDDFIAAVQEWEKHYGRILDDIPERGWVVSDIKRARSMLIKALPNMFHYLDDPNIPTTTNGLEGYFARLKNHYRQHRGLSVSLRANYFAWYFNLRSR